MIECVLVVKLEEGIANEACDVCSTGLYAESSPRAGGASSLLLLWLLH